jgi:large subunit ribosomal protein L15
MYLHELESPKGARKKRKIVGRGPGSGHGGTSGRGDNGQNCRAGKRVGALEGGQVPLIRRLPKVGFRSHRPIVYQVVNLDRLNQFKEKTVIDAEFLKSRKLITSLNKPFKILGNGEIKKALIICADNVSKTAREKIVKAGGEIKGDVAKKPDEAKAKNK